MKDICMESISKAFGEKQVLRDFSAVLPGGGITCLMGPSGCGKTTLLRILAGLEKADSGRVQGMPESVAFVFQEDRLTEKFSALTNIRLVTGRKKSREEIIKHLEELGIGESALLPVQELSGGMKRRVAIARAVLYGGGALFLDEAFKGLDEANRKIAMDYMLRHREGRTLLCVTHEESEAAYLGGSLLRMETIQ